MGTVRREALDHLLIFGRRHLDHVLREYVEHYQRPHQGLGQRIPGEALKGMTQQSGRVALRDRLGGLIHEYNRAA